MPSVKGIGVSHGIAFGEAFVIGRRDRDVRRHHIQPDETRAELRRFLGARRQAREEIVALRKRAAQSVGEKYAGIFDAHVMILDDRKLGRETMELVRERRMNAEWALAVTVGKLLKAFESVEDPYLRERGGDIQDVHERLQRILEGEGNRHARDLDLEQDTVIVASSLSPSDAIWLHQPRIVAIVTEEGSRTSHTAILANALEIPAVLGARGVTSLVEEDEAVIVDGDRGRLVYRASEAVTESYRREREEQMRLDSEFVADREPAQTVDGIDITVSANIEFPEEMETCKRVGAQGIGLYRSEFLFLATAPDLPSEDDHKEAYLRIARGALPDRVVIRTLDLGGEKYFHEVLEGGEANPVMGMRAVRFCLRRPDIFRTQLRGLYKAATECGNIWMLIPMISGLEEWRQVRALLREVAGELRDEGFEVPRVPVGCMIEVPAAALEAERLAQEADFFSIGTNDLIQYTLAVDRANGNVAYLYDPYHPAVLRLIRRAIAAAHDAGIPVNLCGEMASDPLGALTLLGLGLELFSCNALLVPEIRSLLRKASATQADLIVESALEMGSGSEIKARLLEGFGPIIERVLGASALRDDLEGEA